MCRPSKYMYIVDFHLLDSEANGLINNVTIRTFQHSMHLNCPLFTQTFTFKKKNGF